MTNISRWIVFTLCLIAGPLMISSGRGVVYAGSSAAAGSVDLGSVCPAATGLPPLKNENDPSQVQMFGWQVFQSLVQTPNGQLKDTPDWEAWDTKCAALHMKSACLDGPIPGAAGQAVIPGRPSGNSAASGGRSVKRVQPRLMKSLEVSKRVGKTTKLGRLPTNAQLQSVHYNCFASQSIAQQMGTLAARGKILPLRAGAIIVKALWEPVPTRGESVAVSTLTPSAERSFNPAKDSDQQLALPGSLLTPQPEWGTLDPASCMFSGSKQRLVSECIHRYVLPGGVPDHGVVNNCQTSCTAELVGLQMMVRAQPGHDWIWISLWWNGLDNNVHSGLHLPAPWRYYAMGATNQDRSGAKVDGMQNILFNPYLEGVSLGTGRVSNCRNCHEYAGFDKGGTSTASNQSVPANLVAPALARFGGRDIATPEVINKYLQLATPTDSSWSVAGGASKLTAAAKIASKAAK